MKRSKMANKCIKKYSTFMAIKKMEIKTTLRFLSYHPTE
jgi:hypothetical protein